MTLDANIVIDYLHGDVTVIERLSQWKREGVTFLIPTMAEAEILSFHSLTSTERTAIESYIENNFTSIPFDRAVARIAAEIRRGFRVKLPDAAIAATALYTHTPVVTRNVKDFRHIKGLDLLTI